MDERLGWRLGGPPEFLPPLRSSSLLVIGCFAALFVTAVRPVTDNDVWWHLATGRYILATGTVPHQDVYSALAQGRPWIAHEWLTEVILYWVQVHAGYGTLMALWAGVITAAFVVVYRTACALGAARWIALPTTLLAAAASSHTWGVRPQMLSLLLFAVYTALLCRPAGLSRRRAVGLVALMALWVNLHGGFIFGLLALGLQVVAALLAAAFGERPARAGRLGQARLLGLTLGGAAVAALLNPNTWRALLYPFSYLGNNASVRYVAEWGSPNFHEGRYLFFEALLLLTLTALALAPRRPGARELLPCLVLAYLGLQSVRTIPLFCVATAPIAAVALQGLWAARGSRAATVHPALSPGKALVNWIAAAAIAASALLSTSSLTTPRAVTLTQNSAYPARAVAYLRGHAVPRPLLNSYDWGGYLIWTLYPGYRVYIDGRPDMYGEAYVERFMAIYQGRVGWQAELATQRIRSVLVEPDSALARLLALSRGWRLLYHDNQAVLYVR